MIYKGSRRNVYPFHTYLVVSRTTIKFSKELDTTQFIQQVINEKNGKFVFDGEFVDGVKFWTHVLSAFFIEYHDHMRKMGYLCFI